MSVFFQLTKTKIITNEKANVLKMKKCKKETKNKNEN